MDPFFYIIDSDIRKIKTIYMLGNVVTKIQYTSSHIEFYASPISRETGYRHKRFESAEYCPLYTLTAIYYNRYESLLNVFQKQCLFWCNRSAKITFLLHAKLAFDKIAKTSNSDIPCILMYPRDSKSHIHLSNTTNVIISKRTL